MAENDTHYNGTSDISDNNVAAPLPELEERQSIRTMQQTSLWLRCGPVSGPVYPAMTIPEPSAETGTGAMELGNNGG